MLKLICRLLFLLGLLLLSISAHAASVRGQILSDTGLPVEGVLVTLDQTPPDGTPEFSRRSDPFGFYRLTGVPNGSYQLTVTHPAYETVAPATVNLADAGTLDRSFVLTGLPDGPYFDVTVEVTDVTSGVRLAGVPVKLWRFSTPDSPAATETRLAHSDVNGFVVYRGMQTGYYRFTVNDAGDSSERLVRWEEYTTEGTPHDLRHVQKPHMARVLLKHQAQTLTIQARGYDPVADLNNQALKGVVVELTGLDPSDPNRVVVPRRSGITGDDGNVQFTDLPAIIWKATAKRLGYNPASILVNPDTNGSLPAAPVPATLVAQATFLLVEIEDDFADPLYWTLAPIHLKGIDGTNTEGIDRISTFGQDFANGNATMWDWRHFFGLLPGKYRLSFEGYVAGDNYHVFGNQDRRPYFRVNQIIEVPAIDQATLNLATHPRIVVRAQAVPATVRGRLFAADQTSLVEHKNEVSSSFERLPLYQPKAQNPGGQPPIIVQLIEYDSDQFLAPEQRTRSVAVDANGEFSLPLLPGRYGIRVLNAESYWGSHVRLDNLTGGTSRNQGWPFHQVWPWSGFPPTNGTGNNGEVLVIRSGDDYHLDIFLRKKTVTARATVIDDLENPTRSLIVGDGYTTGYSDLVLNGGEVILDNGQGTTFTTNLLPGSPGQQAGPSSHAYIEVPALPPGNWTYTVGHPRFDFSISGSPVFMVPEWPAPGELPLSDPSHDTLRPLDTVTGESYVADYIAGNTTLDFTEHYYDDFLEGSPPAIVWRYHTTPGEFSFDDLSGVSLIEPGYTPAGLLFRPASNSKMPQGSFGFWRSLFTGDTFQGQAEPGGNDFHIYYAKAGYEGVPNPALNVADTPDGSPYKLTLISANVDDTTQLVNGTTMIFADGSLSANQSYSGRTGPYNPTSVQNANWLSEGGSIRIKTYSPLEIEVVRLFSRGMAVAGNVTANSGIGTAPVEAATVRLSDRYGNLLGTALTDENGDFSLSQALARSQPVYAEVRVPGFIPWRQRYSGGDATDTGSGNLQLEVEATLQPLPPPAADSVARDRFGLFLPGVSRAGDTAIGNYLVAEEPLTMTWTVQATAANVTVPVNVFDNADGSSPAATSRLEKDFISEAWLIDPRKFTGDPLTTAPADAAPPLSGEYFALKDWLDNIRTGIFPNVFHQRLFVAGSQPDGSLEVSGKVPLWELPPGPFEPLLVLVTKLGGISVHEAFEDATPTHRLTGAVLPPWLARATDVMATINSAQTTAAQLDGYLPLGQLNFLPAFTATIQTDENNFLHYDYAVLIDWQEGVETPDSGFLMFAPGLIGVNFEATAAFGADGAAGNLYFTAGTQGANEPQDIKSSLLPKVAQGKVEPKGVLGITAGTTFKKFVDPLNSPNEIEFETSVGTDFEVNASVPLGSQAAKLIPSIGAVVLALEETGALTLSVEADAGVSLDATRLRVTEFPPSAENGGTTFNQVFERDVFGGQPRSTLTNTLTLGMRFGIGMKLDVASRAKVQVALRLTGNPNLNGKPSTKITFNPLGDWPPIQRIEGAFTGKVDASLDAWITSFEKSWEFELISFDHQFGTESGFHWVPLNISVTRRGPAGAGSPANFIGQAPVLISNIAANARLASTQAGGHDFQVFTDVDPANGQMLLKIARRDGVAFDEPITVATADGIVDAVMAEVTPGTLMLVWSQIESTGADNPWPPSTLRYALSTDYSNWGTPQTLASLNGVGLKPRFVIRDGLAGLAFLETTDGPLYDTAAIRWSTWNGNTQGWSGVATLEPAVNIAGFDARGSGLEDSGPALIAWSEASGALHSRVWNGASFEAKVQLDDEAAAGLALAPAWFNDQRTMQLAYGLQTGGIAVQEYQSISGWEDMGIAVAGALPTEIWLDQLIGTDQSMQNLFVWIQGSDVDSVWYAWTQEDLTPLGVPVNLSANLTGSMSRLQVYTGPGFTAQAVALHDDGTVSVKEYAIGMEISLPLLMPPVLLPGGGVDLTIFLNPGQPYRVQRSNDLNVWFDWRVIQPQRVQHTLTDENATAQDPLFYRVVEVIE